MYSGTYKDCIQKQKQLEREELDGENAENELDGENAEKEFNGEKELDVEHDNKPKRKRKLIKVYMCTIFDRAHNFWTYV